MTDDAQMGDFSLLIHPNEIRKERSHFRTADRVELCSTLFDLVPPVPCAVGRNREFTIFVVLSAEL